MEEKSSLSKLNIQSSKNKDLIYILLFSISLFIIFSEIDFFEHLIELTREYEEYELDEVITLIFISGFSLLWYSIRRHREINLIQSRLKELNNSLSKQLKIEIEKSNKVLADLNKELASENIEKDHLISKNSKMVLMGEMMENIIHQWRQPLTAISIGASGIKIQHEFSQLDEKYLIKSCDNIIYYTEYLSETIDDFRNFFKEDKIKKTISLEKDVLHYVNKLLGSQLSHKNIKIIDNLNDTKLFGHKNDLIQVVINIFNNSQDELEKIDSKKYIFIESYEENANTIIKIKDNANGAPKKILDNIYKQYFTTKDEAIGTGVGLFMCKRIIEESFEGKIESINNEYTYNNKNYKGLETTITIPNKSN